MNILNFCSQRKDERRPLAMSPWFLDGHTIATDSRILIRTKDIGPWPVADPENYPVDGARKLLSEGENTDISWWPAPKATISGYIGKLCWGCKGVGRFYKTTCNECDGEGYLTFDTGYNDYEVECKSCYGNGGVRRPSINGNTVCDECGGAGYILPDFDIHGVLIDYKFLSKILPIKNLEIATAIDQRKLFFRAPGVFGLIMGKYRDDQARPYKVWKLKEAPCQAE